jgi:hypothetical protein
MLIAFNERSERQVQLSAYFDQLFKSFKNQDWDTKKIDKAIKSIEACNKKISDYRYSMKLNKKLAIFADKAYIIKLISQSFAYAVLTVGLNMSFGSAAGSAATIAGMITMNMPIFDEKKKGMPLPKMISDLEKENNKALEWLKKEKARIEKGTDEKKSLGKIISGKQEVCSIFESVELV